MQVCRAFLNVVKTHIVFSTELCLVKNDTEMFTNTLHDSNGTVFNQKNAGVYLPFKTHNGRFVSSLHKW